jgi:hypothetical protein
MISFTWHFEDKSKETENESETDYCLSGAGGKVQVDYKRTKRNFMGLRGLDYSWL